MKQLNQSILVWFVTLMTLLGLATPVSASSSLSSDESSQNSALDMAESSAASDSTEDETAQERLEDPYYRDALIYPASYQLNAMDIDALSRFYQDNLGLVALESSADYVRLGTTDDRTLLELFKTTVAREAKLSTSLYHTAYLFNDRAYLGSALSHLMVTKSPVEGFTDHGVSNAVYAADIEGNGIELYWDRPEAEWPKDQDTVAMVNEPLDYIELMQSGTEDYAKMDERVKIGHFHLVSNDAEAAGEFYSKVLGLGTTSSAGDAVFQASGAYHHHIANNNWFADQGLTAPQEGQQGLRAIIWQTASADFFAQIKDSLDDLGTAYEEVDAQTIRFLDTNGLGVVVKLITTESSQ